jgi:Meckel syndrome type 1 protein
MTTTPIAGSMPVQPAATAVPAQGEAVATITDAATPTPARPTAMPLPQPAAGPVPVIASTTAAKPQPALTPSAQAAPRMDPDPVAAPQPVPAPPLRAEPVPAAQLFIGQIATALDDRAQRSGARLVDLAVDLSAAGNTGNSRTELPGIAVTAPMAADQGRLDMERREWMTSMIDRIETLRTDGRQDVRIRLSPDALGSIDIRITDRGGIADVQVTAEQANARAMLAEAAPRLNELAESRGLRLNAQFDGSDRQAPGRPPHQPDQDAPSRPRPASSVSTTADAEARPDERIA